MASQNDILELLRTKEAAIGTEELTKELKASREGTRKQLTRLKEKGYVDGDSQEGWFITDDGEKQLDRGGVRPSMVSEGVTERDVFEKIGRRIGINEDRIVLAADNVWSGDYTDLKFVWDALGAAGIRADLKSSWVNSWRHHLQQGIPPELAAVLVTPERKKEEVTEAGVKAEEGRSYILQDDLPVYVGKNLGDLTYDDALDLSKIRAGRAARRGDGTPGQQWGPDEILKIVKAVQEFVPSGAAVPKSYVVSRGEEGKAIVQEVEQGKPVVVDQPASQPGSTYMVNPEGEVKELKPGEPIVIKQPAAAATPQKTFIVKQTSEGTTVVEEHDLGKPIIIQAVAPGGGLPATYPFPATGADGKPLFDSNGNPIYVNVEPMIKWMGFQREQKRSDERHSALMELTGVIKENLPIGIEAFSRAASEVKGKAPESAAQQYECGNCHKTFTLPRVPGEEEKVVCPHCQQEWTGKEVIAT
ncbi:hypothetical protein ES703_91293 [subsurface metagenome]